MRKPKKCPKCGSKSIAKILYGLPAFNDELQKKIDEGKISIGGCCQEIGGPVYECNDCHALICEDGRVEFGEDF